MAATKTAPSAKQESATKSSAVNRVARIAGTGISFTVFGLGGALIGTVLYPTLLALSRNRASLQRRMQYLIHLSFRFFVRFMVWTGPISFEVRGGEKLLKPGQLIVANHPTLIDVVLLIAQIPRANCIVKASLLKNPFTAGPVRSAGYVANSEHDSEALVTRCAEVLSQGQSLIVFPEGTRTTPGTRPKLKRGTANIALYTGAPIVPVHISCHPLMLNKGVPWYKVPPRRGHFTITVGEPVLVQDYLAKHPQRSLAARHLTRDLEELFWPASGNSSKTCKSDDASPCIR